MAMRATTLIGALGLAVGLATGSTTACAQSFPGGNPAHGRTIASSRCAVCHGPDGNHTRADSSGPQIPKLAGQKAAYLYAQLEAFKAGSRTSAVMAPMLAGLSDADLADVSSFFARRTASPDSVTDPDLAAAGERIWLRGTARVRPCALCHSASGMGMMGGMMGGRGMMGRGGMMDATAAAPRLNGQHAGYIRAQLHAFAAGIRQSAIMDPIAASLTPAEARAVAEYLSGLQGR